MKMKMVALITMTMMTLEPATCMTANYSFQWSYIYYYKRSGGTLAMSYTPGIACGGRAVGLCLFFFVSLRCCNPIRWRFAFGYCLAMNPDVGKQCDRDIAIGRNLSLVTIRLLSYFLRLLFYCCGRARYKIGQLALYEKHLRDI